MVETAAKRRRPRPPVQGCAAVDRRSGIRDCTGCGYYRPLSTDLLLGMACHYSLDTGQLREVPPAVCFRRALHRARRPGPGRPRKQREEVSDMTPKTAQDPPAAAGAQSASPAPVMRAKTPVGQGAPDAGETPPAPIARRRTARRDTGTAPAPTPDKEAASAKPPVSAKAPAEAPAKASKKPGRKTAGKSASPEKTPAPAVEAIPGNIDPPTNPLAPAAGETRAEQNTAETAGIPTETSAPAAGDIPGKTDGLAAGETPAEAAAEMPAPAVEAIPGNIDPPTDPLAPAAGEARAKQNTAETAGIPTKPPAPASREIPAGGIFTESPAASQPHAGKGPAEKLEQLLERAAPAAVEALLRTVQDERASCAQRLDAAKILLERAAPRAGGGEGVLRVVLEDGAAELIE